MAEYEPGSLSPLAFAGQSTGRSASRLFVRRAHNGRIAEVAPTPAALSGRTLIRPILADVPDDARAKREEPFVPLALANPVRNLDEAIEKANSLAYGLAAYAFTRSAHNADRLANDVDAGNFSINYFVASLAETPFEGVKDGGCGREGAPRGFITTRLPRTSRIRRYSRSRPSPS
jgi:acyl-CoA reductase-like NAD-dependent aldehyde dehydrogenase